MVRYNCCWTRRAPLYSLFHLSSIVSLFLMKNSTVIASSAFPNCLSEKILLTYFETFCHLLEQKFWPPFAQEPFSSVFLLEFCSSEWKADCLYFVLRLTKGSKLTINNLLKTPSDFNVKAWTKKRRQSWQFTKFFNENWVAVKFIHIKWKL